MATPGETGRRMPTNVLALRKLALPIGAFVLMLLGAGLWTASRTDSSIPPVSAPLTPAGQSSDSVKVVPTPVAALPVSLSQAVPFTDAALARDMLLDAAKAGPWTDPSNPVDIRDYPAWRQRFPNLGLSGYAVAADAYHVSVYRGVFDPSGPPSDTNRRVIAFAVADASGRCAAGVLLGYPTYSTIGAVDVGSARCKAQSVLDRLKR